MNSSNLSAYEAVKDILLDLELSFHDAEGWAVRLPIYPVVGASLYNRLKQSGKIDVNGENEALALEGLARAFAEYGLAQGVNIERVGDIQCRIEVEGCALAAIDQAISGRGIEPFLCPLVNVCALFLEERLGAFVERLDQDLQPERCVHNVTIFKLKPNLTLKEVLEDSPFEWDVAKVVTD
ncbi:MAG: hypothetical protein D9V47_08590 [Clostridia bacterium]|nr:MAG: hypothetical protein D9V47_08590 [Clostridia bacterium]